MKCLKVLVPLIASLSLSVKANALQDIYVIHFVLDGAHKGFLEEQIQKGELPHLKTFFFDKGAVFEQAITTFPTVSSPGYVSFVTGLGAGNSGIVFLEWFDRAKQKVVGYLTPSGYQRVNDDLMNLNDLRSPLTLFEKLAPHPTAALYTPFQRGATLVHPKKFPMRALFSGLVAKDGLMLNRLAMKKLEDIFSNPLPKIPRYTLVGLYGTDFYGHDSGPDSEEVKLVLKQFDQLFSQFLEKLKAQKILEKTTLIVSSDHGMHATGRQLKLTDQLWREGIRKGDKIYVSNRGVSSTFIYVAGEGGWKEMPSLTHLRNFPVKKGPIDLIQTLLKTEGVEWIALRDDFDRVRIYQPGGEGVIAQLTIGEQKFYSYLTRGRDPLGFANDPDLQPFLDGKPHSAEFWFEKTVKTERPNAVVELSQLFRDSRAGDILVVAEEAYGFRKAKAATHGSLNPDDMTIPLWISGPGVPAGRFGPVQSVDLYPTLLNWFGLLNSRDLKYQEGEVLFVKQNSKEDPSAELLATLEGELVKLPPLSKLPNRDSVSEKLRARIPQELYRQVQSQCEEEIERRYRRWKKLDQTEEKVAKPLQENTKWFLANEKNIEFLRLRRMEDIKTILENP